MTQTSHVADKTIPTASVSVTPGKTLVGSWIDCINPFNNPVKHGFFRHVPSDPRFNENDKAKICPLCWDEAQRRNGTLVQAPRPSNTSSWVKHSQSKASDDLL